MYFNVASLDIRCDGIDCDEQGDIPIFDDGDEGNWPTREEIEDAILSAGWEHRGGSHFCPTCS